MVVNFRAREISRGTRKLACKLGVSTKIEKPIKPEKKPKKPNRKKKPIKILKKPTGSVRFCKSKTKKTEPNPNQKIRKNRAKLEKKPRQTEPKQSQTGKNRAKIKPNEKNRAKPI